MTNNLGTCEKCGRLSVSKCRRIKCKDCGSDVWCWTRINNESAGRVKQYGHNIDVARARANAFIELMEVMPEVRWSVSAASDGEWYEAHARKGKRSRTAFSIIYSGRALHRYYVYLGGDWLGCANLDDVRGFVESFGAMPVRRHGRKDCEQILIDTALRFGVVSGSGGDE